MEYITVTDDVITGHFCGPTLPDGAILVPAGWSGQVGEHMRAYTPNWELRPISERIRDGLVALELGYVVDGDLLRAMTHVERITAGLDDLPLGYVVDGDLLRPETEAEQYASGKIDIEFIADKRRAEREDRIRAVEWRYERYYRQVRLSITPTDDLCVLDAYVQTLADITVHPDWPFMEWPNAI